jgi:hypothetical protein
MSMVYLSVAALALAMAFSIATLVWFVASDAADSGTCRPVAIHTRRPMMSRAWRALKLAVLRWELRCVVEERIGYLRDGVVGVQYLRNSRDVELRLRRLILNLELY